MPTVHGVPLSPYVRKVRIALIEKGIDHDINPVVPIPPANDAPEFRAMSPLGKIPAYEDGDFAFSDSSVIIAYLERTQPGPALYPQNAKDYARALWLEEFSDTKMVEAVGPVFFERIVAPNFMERETNQELVDEALNERIPFVFDYMEGKVNGGDYLVGESFSVADVGVGSVLRQYRLAGETVDTSKWPRLAAYADSILGRASFVQCAEVENKAMSGG